MVDVSFNCRADAGGRDPDSHSPTLRRFHQRLWSKRLPSGQLFDLDISGPKPFLVHRSDLGEFFLTSDCITHTYADRLKIKSFLEHLDEDQYRFVSSEAWSIGDCTVFPGKRVDGKNTINGARGMNSRIGDRFDLTLECIRRHYLGQSNPLEDVLNRYQGFFALFGDFKGYVDYFLLQDLVTEYYSQVEFYLPFDEFQSSPLPQDLEAYKQYLRGVEAFSMARSARILTWCKEQTGP